ncbi:glutamate formimidoyltransferase [Clostridium estertheticum]|uniref:glutamate formimidoyltransferase n=1 Tax=Clostridium estertheticum TaxID=238834 RepID=UPI0013E955DE|nr:glutamate formimidoyltransferase [Clostridium estertheticum]MBZ9686823.1 glutamate formimidoyltransferase [Clostridium estertheticum]
MKILLCEANISEGRNEEIICSVKDVLLQNDDVKMIDFNSDKDHNRSVFTYIGEPEMVLEATKRLVDKALELIDMTKHHGSHPRMGAVDVVPFVPVKGIEIQEAVEISKRFGRYIGSKGVPVYYYENAATSSDRTSLVNIRRGEYEGLAEKMKKPEWIPDEGPVEFIPKSGALVTGVRFPLVAFNVNLRTNDIEIANRIAKAVRNISGGFRYVRAIGLHIAEKDMVQVSMNLINYTKTPIPRVMETVRSEAARYGVMIASAELVGPVPIEALEEVVRHCLQVHDFSIKQIIETNLLPE